MAILPSELVRKKKKKKHLKNRITLLSQSNQAMYKLSPSSAVRCF